MSTRELYERIVRDALVSKYDFVKDEAQDLARTALDALYPIIQELEPPF